MYDNVNNQFLKCAFVKPLLCLLILSELVIVFANIYDLKKTIVIMFCAVFIDLVPSINVRCDNFCFCSYTGVSEFNV